MTITSNSNYSPASSTINSTSSSSNINSANYHLNISLKCSESNRLSSSSNSNVHHQETRNIPSNPTNPATQNLLPNSSAASLCFSSDANLCNQATSSNPSIQLHSGSIHPHHMPNPLLSPAQTTTCHQNIHPAGYYMNTCVGNGTNHGMPMDSNYPISAIGVHLNMQFLLSK